jgi:hypothetical protein
MENIKKFLKDLLKTVRVFSDGIIQITRITTIPNMKGICYTCNTDSSYSGL